MTNQYHGSHRVMSVYKIFAIKTDDSPQVRQDLANILEEYDIVKRRYCKFKCSRQPCEHENAGGVPTTIIAQQNVKKSHDFMQQDRRMTIKDTGL